jgi:probable phosphoglycerate mutase
MGDPTLYLLRHGETEFNVQGRYQGWSDSPLTARGRDQARRHGALLKTLIEAPQDWRLVASPLGRALASARIVCAGLGLPEAAIATDNRLKEMAFGQWEGLTAGDTIVVGHGGAGRVLRGLYGRLSEAEILALDEPQDAIFRLAQGTVARIEHGG